MFNGPFSDSIIARAQAKGLVTIRVHNLRDWTADKHKTADDRPFGGGVGMILKPEPIFKAVEEIKIQNSKVKIKNQKLIINTRVILLSPRGQTFNQSKAVEVSKQDRLILICGRYEGVDERVSEHLIDEEISIGDYVLSGGELPAMVLTEAVVRLIPGVLEKEDATKLESFSSYGLPTIPPCEAGPRFAVANYQLLEHPQYTRPEDFRGLKVPAVLLSGNHKDIEKWRREKSLEATKKNRPDLIG